MRNRLLRKGMIVLGIGVAAIVLLLLICDWIVVGNASGRTFDNASDVPHRPYGILLATSPVTKTGAHNYTFDNRIIAADQLFKAGKIDTLIASGGDYTGKEKYGCDEPRAIRDSLVKRGVDAGRIILDYDGTRTLKSIINAKETFSLDTVILISQKSHNERAIYLADSKDVYAVGFNADSSPFLTTRIKLGAREYLARVKMFLDLATQ